MEKINVYIAGDQGTAPVITIREGSALELNQPVQISMEGDIHTIKSFLEKRTGKRKGGGQQLVNPETAIVSVNEQKMTILLALNPEDVNGAEISGKLEVAPELSQFYINTTKQFTREELIRLFRFSKRFFDSAENHEKIMIAYQKLNLSTTSELKKDTDTRGNKDLSFKKNITSDIPEDFILNLPVFKGEDKERFRVEICMDATDTSVRFWFESVELVERMELRRDEIFAEELESCKDLVVIYT